MKRICVLSDTHGLLRNEVKAELSQADIIIHAGDIGSDAILKGLEQYGKLYAVRGNNDKNWAESLPQNLSVDIEGVHFFIVHNKKDIPKNLTDIDVVIYGHSHQFEDTLSNGVLFINPGSCGKRRFNLDLSFCCMIVTGNSYNYHKIEIKNNYE